MLLDSAEQLNSRPNVIDVEVLDPPIGQTTRPEQSPKMQTNSKQPNLNQKTSDSNVATSGDNFQDLKSLRKQNRGNRGRFFTVFLVIVSILGISGIAFTAAGYNFVAGLNDSSFGQENQSNNFIDQLTKINPFKNSNDELNNLQGARDGRINILLLGNGGESHSGGSLTDSQIIYSIFTKEKKISTMNIPRDLYVRDGNSTKKANSVFADAESSAKGSGARKLASILEGELNTKIHYWAVIDFTGFKNVVDAVGGIELNIRNSFCDNEYPDDKLVGYIRPAPCFKQGNSKMDGRTALIYARSRKAPGEEGGDFARSLRQREVITAIIKKTADSNTINDLDKINKISKAVQNNFKTSFQISEIVSLGKVLKEYDLKANTYSWTLDSGGDILCASNSEGTGYILQYCDGAVFGASATRLSKSRIKLQEGFADILNISVKEKLDKISIAVISNKSKTFDTVYNAVVKQKGSGVLSNNQYKEINPTAYPTVTVYTKDSSSQDVVNYLVSKNLGFETKQGGQLPANKILPKNLTNAQIIFWIE